MADDVDAADRSDRAADIAVSVLFVLLLIAPGLLSLAGRYGADTDFITHHEMRVPYVAPAPTVAALADGGWERDAERQIADDFPFRRSFIESYELAKYFVFQDVASSHVTLGKDGWLFYADTERSYDDGTYAPTDAQLAALADVYKDRATWCARHGATYLFVLAPNKSTVYPRYLPPSARHVTPTAGERLIAMVRARGVRALDLRGTLQRAAAADDDVYSKGDTHWSDVGAYDAYREIVRELGLRDTIAPGSIVRRVALQDGDLDRLAGIASAVPDRVVHFDFAHRARDLGAPDYPPNVDAGELPRDARAVDDPRLPKAVVFGDSFLLALGPFLVEDFSRTVVVERDAVHGIVRPVIEAEKPAFVIEETVERNLVHSGQFEP